MKVNCRALKLAIKISIILFIMALLFKVLDIKYSNNVTEFMKDCFLGSFCSSIITVFFYTSAYKVEKRKTLEQYWNECRKMIMGLYKIDYMNIDSDENIFVNFIKEQSGKKWKAQYYKMLKKEIPKNEFENTELIKGQIKDDNKELFDSLSKDTGDKYLEEEIEELYSKTTDKINKIIDQYLNYIEQSMDKLNIILGDIEFFTGDNNYLKAYKLFEALFNLRVKIQESSRHFRYYKDGDGNKAIVLSEIFKLQKSIFKVEENEKSKIIYREFSDIMEEKLEEFRARIIYNVEPEKIPKTPLYEIVKIK